MQHQDQGHIPNQGHQHKKPTEEVKGKTSVLWRKPMDEDTVLENEGMSVKERERELLHEHGINAKVTRQPLSHPERVTQDSITYYSSNDVLIAKLYLGFSIAFTSHTCTN